MEDKINNLSEAWSLITDRLISLGLNLASKLGLDELLADRGIFDTLSFILWVTEWAKRIYSKVMEILFVLLNIMSELINAILGLLS